MRKQERERGREKESVIEIHKIVAQRTSIRTNTIEHAQFILFWRGLILWHTHTHKKRLMNRRSINCLLTCLSFNYGSVVCWAGLFVNVLHAHVCVFMCVRCMSSWVIAWLNNVATKQFIRAASYSHNRARHRYLFICYWMTDWPVRTPSPPPPPPSQSSQSSWMSLSRLTQFKWKENLECHVICVNKVTEIVAIAWVDSFFLFRNWISISR